MFVVRRWKGIVLGILLVAVIAAIAGGITTRRALETAEALRFRRMLVNRIGDDDSFRFFFATNRSVEAGDAPLKERFTIDIEGLQLGFFDSSIEPALGIGMLVNTSDWFRDEEIRLDSIALTDSADFVARLRKQVQASPERSLLISVNGFREQFPSALRKTAFLAHVLDIDTPHLVFDWPGNQGSTPRGYRAAQQAARGSADHLAELIRLAVDEVQPDKLWILANSMGGEVVVNAFHKLYADRDWADAEQEIDHVFLTAPDVSYSQFGDRFGREIMALTRDTTVYVSSNDRALLMSRLLNRDRRLGQSTVDPSNPSQLDAARRIYELLPEGQRHIALIDVTPVNRTRNFHNFSLETPEFFDDIFLRTVSDNELRSRRLYRVREQDEREYWVLTRGR